MIQAPTEEKAGPARASGFGPCYFDDLGPHLVLPAGIAGDRQDHLAVLGQDEAWRRIWPRLALLARQEGGQDPSRVGWPVFWLQHQRLVGGMHHPIVEFLACVRFDEVRFRLGTPDLAAASKFVTDEHQ